MNLSSLHIFSKNRDSYAAQRGYSYQHLATLKTWLENRIEGNKAIIYCDYEDDIFITNQASTIAGFTQIKLYSDSFSFSSDEIRKTLVNFFMLFVKGDYAHHTVNFRFETNTNIARKKGDNAADVLKNWMLEQGNISSETLALVRTQVKAILAEYVESESARVKSDDARYNEVQKAKVLFEQMQDEDVDKFISCISWQFDGNSPKNAMEKLKAKVEALVSRLPIAIKSQDPSTIIAVLGQAVREASEQANPDLRKIDEQKLDSILLSIGDEEQKWYNEAYIFWKGIEGLTAFNQGAFQEVVDATRYCRYELPGSGHNLFWIQLLQQFIDLNDIDIASKRKAIYEQVFIALDPMLMNVESELDFKQYEPGICYYFENWSVGENFDTIEDDIALLQIVETLIKYHGINIAEEEVKKWYTMIEKWIDEGLQMAGDADKMCTFLLLKGHSLFRGSFKNEPNRIKGALDYYRQILPLLKGAKLFSIGTLYRQLDKFMEMVLSKGVESKVMDMVFAFMDELSPYANAAQQGFLVGQNAVKQGARFLTAGGKSNTLKALSLFHRARMAYLREDLMEGYILGLLNLAQVYGMLGMHLAAKKYALTAVYFTWQISDPTQYKRIVSGMQLLFHSDFNVGAWVTSLSTFQHLLSTIHSFDPLLLEREGNEFLMRNIIEVSLIGYSQPFLCPGIKHYVDYVTGKMDITLRGLIKFQQEQLEANGIEEDKLIRLIKGKVFQAPFSDVGAKRQIRFNAFKINWTIRFSNTHIDTGMAEEFVASLQILLTELTVKDEENFVEEVSVEIKVLKGTELLEPILVAPNTWQVTIPHFESKVESEIKQFNARLLAGLMKILRSLTKDEAAFKQQYVQLLRDEHLGDKLSCINTYQKMYAHCYDEGVSNASGKQHFADIILPEFPQFFKTAI